MHADGLFADPTPPAIDSTARSSAKRRRWAAAGGLLAAAALVTGLVGPFSPGASSSASQPGFVSVGVGSLANGCGIGQTANHFYSTSPGGATLARACGATVYAALQSVEFDGKGTLVTTGDNGQIQTSIDGGVTWVARTSPTINQLMSVAYNGSSWLAVGASETTLWSPDGFNWTARKTCCGNIWNAVAGNASGTWVRVGGGGKLATSTDNGVSWTARDSKVITGLNSVSWDGQRFIAAGDNGQITRSTDGVNWTKVTPAPGFGIAIWEVRGNGSTWIAVGPPATSPNTANVLRSTDGGSTWTRITAGLATPGETFYSVGFDPASTSWMAVGLGGTAGSIFRSADDGLSWTRVAPPNTAAQYSVIHSFGGPPPTTTTTAPPTTAPTTTAPTTTAPSTTTTLPPTTTTTEPPTTTSSEIYM